MKNKNSNLALVPFSKAYLVLPAVIVAWFLGIAVLFGATQAWAQDANPYADKSIAVIDLQALMRDSDAADSIRKQVDAKRATYQKEIEQLEGGLKDKEEALKKAQGEIGEKEFVEKRRAFERDVVEAQREIREKRSVLERAFAEAMAKLRGEALKVIADVAGTRKIDVVLTRQQVVIVDSKIDITEPVIEQLNDAVTKISVSFKES